MSKKILSIEEVKGVIFKLLRIKMLEFNHTINNVQLRDLIEYIEKVILRNKIVKNINDISYYIFNIKVNRIIEYQNLKAIVDKTDTLESDLKDILEG